MRSAPVAAFTFSTVVSPAISRSTRPAGVTSITAMSPRVDGVTLFQERSGSGRPVVLLHGLTATHRYVVMGSKALQCSGHDVRWVRGRGGKEPTVASHGDSISVKRITAEEFASIPVPTSRE